MSSHKDQKGHGLLNMMKSASSAARKSPQMVRRTFKAAKRKVGGGKDYSTLDDCENNGWLHTDDSVAVGVPYAVQYLGSIEVNYQPNDPAQNNKWAIEAMRVVRDSCPKGEPHTLSISVGRITLTAEDLSVVMRHSTSRIAYSTVDHEAPKLFSYVALPKKQNTPLCHVFLTKSAKKSYEMTFTCAQAFDKNFAQWQENREVALRKAAASEAGDVEPAKAMPSPRPIRKVLGQANGRSSPLAVGGIKPQTPPVDRIADAGNPEQPAKPMSRMVSKAELEIEPEQDEEAMDAIEKYFTSLKAASSEPNMLQIGVDPEHFNNAADE